ncbi:MAG: DNA primase [Chloroflexota bacterium]|nr:DNA primase [Anaerolineae bacterium]
MSVVDEIKQRLDIVDVVSGYVPLKKAGRNFKGLCPFHSEKTPSFVVFPETQNWHCFGACGTGGDVFSFVMRRENMDFREALRYLAKRAGVSLVPPSPEAAKKEDERERLRRINTEAAQYYHRLLRESDEGASARDYLEQRGIEDRTLQAFQLGYSQDRWDGLSRYLTGKGHSEADLLAAGLVSSRETGGIYDRFRGRLIIPIRDIRGQVVGFGARILQGEGPKYINSPQTLLFDKGSILYGIDLAKDAIRRADLIVIVEGYMDVLMAHQHGISNVVASMGTALTEKQFRTFKRFTKRLVLALDADVAGDQATLRGLDVAQEVMDHRTVPVPSARGRIRYEEQLDAEILILTLPDELDPDEVIRADPLEWKRLVEEALPLMEYYFKALLAGLDLSVATEKSEAANRLLPIIAGISSPVEQAHYLQRLARLLRVDERTLLWQMRKTGSAKRRGARDRDVEVSIKRSEAMPSEDYCLYMLLKLPTLLVESKTSISEDDLWDTENRELLLALRESVKKRGCVDLTEFVAGLDTSLQGRVEWLLNQQQGKPSLSLEQAEESFAKAVWRMRRERSERLQKECGSLISDAQERGDSDAVRNYGDIMSRLIVEKRDIDRRAHAVTLVGRGRDEEVRW